MQFGHTLTARMGGLTLGVVVALLAVSRLLGPGKPAETEPAAAPGAVVANRMTEVVVAKKPAGPPAVALTPVGPAPHSAPPRDADRRGGAHPAPSAQEQHTALLDAPAAPSAERERVEADVSTRSVAVTSAFTGVEIVVFGSVINTQSESAESGLYDVVVVVEGAHAPLIARKKSNVAGIWINTSSVSLNNIPSYYAIASTRPLTEIAEGHILSQYRIGFDHMHMDRPPGSDLTDDEFTDFRHAVIRLKKKEGVYLARDYAVAFIGQSLFRATIALPANVPVGPLSARVHLFKEGEHLSSYMAKVKLEREGVERWLHTLAFDHGAIYGILTVIIAVASGLLASMMFRKAGAH